MNLDSCLDQFVPFPNIATLNIFLITQTNKNAFKIINPCDSHYRTILNFRDTKHDRTWSSTLLLHPSCGHPHSLPQFQKVKCVHNCFKFIYLRLLSLNSTLQAICMLPTYSYEFSRSGCWFIHGALCNKENINNNWENITVLLYLHNKSQIYLFESKSSSYLSDVTESIWDTQMNK